MRSKIPTVRGFAHNVSDILQHRGLVKARLAGFPAAIEADTFHFCSESSAAGEEFDAVKRNP
ncbi:hypothetical protein [Ensifer adhaerens]|uniref:hypothetical protein n=1 Tax=Ensifer adhaerens TaxID=106592 RepID=UPI00159EC24F|nr:hypothetical protein [Ensifer adhaerens]